MTSPVYGASMRDNTPLHEVGHGIVARDLGGRGIKLEAFEITQYDPAFVHGHSVRPRSCSAAGPTPGSGSTRRPGGYSSTPSRS
jgi:hypothetical protein